MQFEFKSDTGETIKTIVTTEWNDKLEEFYTMAYEEKGKKLKYLTDKKQYQPDVIAQKNNDYYFYTEIDGRVLSAHVVDRFEGMPDNWIRVFSKLYNLKEFTTHPDHYKIRAIDFSLFAKLSDNILITQNITDTGAITFDNYSKTYKRYKRLCKYFQPMVPDLTFRFDFNDIAYINKTPQVVIYASKQQQAIEWLKEFVVHED
jgi:hypothetical protein